MTKIPYEAPAVKKVHLVIQNSVLAVCHTSPSQTPHDYVGAPPCNLAPGCFSGPGGAPYTPTP